MFETENYIETRDIETNGQAPEETVLFDLLPTASFFGSVTIVALDVVTGRPYRKVVDVAGLFSDTTVLFDAEIAENLRVQIIIGNEDMKVVFWDNAGRRIRWHIVGNIDQTREINA